MSRKKNSRGMCYGYGSFLSNYTALFLLISNKYTGKPYPFRFQPNELNATPYLFK
jgi:hypothetical protein